MTSYQGRRAGGYHSQIPTRYMWRVVLAALIFVAASILVLVYEFTPVDNVIEDLDVGDVASRTVLAPQQFEYISEIQTEAKRKQAGESVSTVYTRPDPKVARQQVDRLRKIFDYLETIRADPYGSIAEKSEWVAAIPVVTLSDPVVDTILYKMSDEDWSKTRQEALAVLNQAMQTEIRESQVGATRRRLPTLIRLDTPDEYANVIIDITEDLIQSNTFPDESRTESDRQTAIEAVEPVKVTVEQNEAIVSTGQIVTSQQKESLDILRNLQQPDSSWFEELVAPALLMVSITIIVGIYLLQYIPRVLRDGKRLLVLTLLLLVFVTLAKFMLSNLGLAYLYPIAALTMITVIVIDVQLAFILTTVLALLAGYLAPNHGPVLVVFLIFSGWTGALALGKSHRVNALLWASVYVGLVNTAIILILNFPAINFTIEGIVLILGGVVNAFISVGVALISLFIIGNVVGITTPLQLLDLSRPTHPLQRDLLLKAPGSYQHSLMVGNLAEQAAERIGGDALLVRVMASYHDIGKIQRPYFFIENQREGVNVHEKLEPQISAQIIIGHVKDGLELARKYRLPQVIKDGIAQHHGTSVVRYFYHQALKSAEEKNTRVNVANFSYSGPIPQTRELGVLMLADVSETTVRALKPNSAEEIDQIVGQAIADKLNSGQLNNCDLTIADLHNIRTAFVDILQGVHHPRIKYPGQDDKGGNKSDEGDTSEEEDSESKNQTSPAAEKRPRPETKPDKPVTSIRSALTSDEETRPSRLVRRE